MSSNESLSEKVFSDRIVKLIGLSSPYSYTYSYTPISSPLFLSRIWEIRVYEYVYEYVFLLLFLILGPRTLFGQGLTTSNS